VTFLVDADVLSEPTKPLPNKRVIAWLDRFDAHLATNPIILGELQFGILKLPAGRRQRHLLDWFAEGVRRLQMFVLDGDTADIWAKLLAELRRKGRMMPVRDSLIAATARQHGLTVVTRNVSDFEYTRVSIVNPFES
jgi:predicted nucleic acid-binding protein